MKVFCASLILMMFALPVLAGDLKPSVLADSKNSHWWVILENSLSLSHLLEKGQAGANGYFVIPKIAEVPFEILDEGKSLRVYFPSTAQYTAPTHDLAAVEFPKGLGVERGLSLVDQMDVKIRPELLSLLQTYGMDAQINYQALSEAGEIRRTNLQSVSLRDLQKALSESLSNEKAAFFTVTRFTGAFTQRDAQALVDQFSHVINSVVIKFEKKTLVYAYPELKTWMFLMNQKPVKFFEAYSEIDQNLVPLVSSALGTESPQLQSSDFWKMNFIKAATLHYYTSLSAENSCEAYDLKLRTHFKNENYSFTYFEPSLQSLEIKFVAVPN